jgi:NADH-quinone oxidoreductase subunit L
MVSHSSAAWGMPLHWHEGDTPFFGGDPHVTMYYVSGVVGLLGLSIAFYFHLYNRKVAITLEHAIQSRMSIRWIPRLLEKKWYMDEIYNATVRIPTWLCARLLYLFDRLVIDGIFVGGIARIPMFVARIFQPLQSGMLQGYATTMAGGVSLIVAWIIWTMTKGGG